MEPLTPEQVFWARQQVGRWFLVRARHERARFIRHLLEARYEDTDVQAAAVLAQMAADADHSALLVRLLQGKDPLPAPPPLSHSYPAYPEGG